MSSAEKAKPDFIIVPGNVLRDSVISPSAKLAYGRLRFYEGEDKRIFMKHDTLGAEIRLSNRQVRNVLAELRAAGWLDWKRGRTTCFYTLHQERQKTEEQARADVRKLRSDRQHSADLDRQDSAEQDRQHSATEIGNIVPTEKNIEDHHQKRKSKKVFAKASTVVEARGEDRTPKPFSSKTSDDEKPKTPVVYATPELELRDIYRRKTGEEIAPAVERRIWEALELQGVPKAQFLEELRKHTGNAWKNPAGFLTNFARRIKSNTTPEQPAPEIVEPPEPPKTEHGNCSVCKGVGYLRWDTTPRQYCTCRMGRDLERMDERIAREAEEMKAFDAAVAMARRLNEGKEQSTEAIA